MITDINDAALDEFRKIKFAKQLEMGEIIIESKKAVDRAISNKVEVKSVLTIKENFDTYKDFDPIITSEEIIDELTGFKLHSSVLAIAKMPVPTPSQIEGPVVVLDGLTSPENVGNLVRTAANFGFSSLFFHSEGVSPYLRRCIRVSMGHVFHLDVYKFDRYSQIIQKLKELNYQFVVLDANERSKEIHEYKFSEKQVIFCGAEGRGISHELKEYEFDTVLIPKEANCDSLNVSSSFAIAAYLSKNYS